jgi:hypothetical protein
MLDVNGHVATWNSGAQRIKGYSADEIIGQHFSSSICPTSGTAAGPTTSCRLPWKRSALSTIPAFARAEDRKRSLLAGYHAHLAKPFDVTELILVVAGLLGR